MAPISMKLLGMATLVASANMMAANAQATNVELCSDVGGIASGGVCCLESCGDCGGGGCPSRTGGAENCCVGQIVAAGVSCDDGEAPCILEEGTFVEEGEEGEEVDDDEENEVVPTPSPAATNSPGGAPTAEPTTAAPTTAGTTTAGPTTAAPSSSAPTSSAPTTAAPTTSAPTSSAPTSSAPTSSAPTTSAPTSSAPTTSAPTTPAPSTPIGGGVISTMAPTPGSRGGDFGTTSSDTMSPTVSATGVGSGSGSDIDGLDFTEAPTAAPTGAPSGADDSRDLDVDDDAIEGTSGALGMLATRPFSGGAAYAWGALGLAMASAVGMLL